eukprot:1559649-Alexandrium_andersonii.AAC.1
MGFLPARAKRSEIGRTPHTCQGSMNRISSARAAAASSESRTAPVISPRRGELPDSAPRPPECSDTCGADGSSTPRKNSETSLMSASPRA